MGLWIEMRDRDGIAFRQWRRTTTQEEVPDDGLVCVCCNACAQEVAVPGTNIKRLAMTHDFHMHQAWRTALGGAANGPGMRVVPVQPVGTFGYDDAAD